MKKPLSDHELSERYDDMLDEVFGLVRIAGLDYATSLACKEVDPTAYRCGFNDWLDSEISNETLFERDGEYFDEDPNLDEESEA